MMYTFIFQLASVSDSSFCRLQSFVGVLCQLLEHKLRCTTRSIGSVAMGSICFHAHPRSSQVINELIVILVVDLLLLEWSHCFTICVSMHCIDVQ
jgi:hypothetical protein